MEDLFEYPTSQLQPAVVRNSAPKVLHALSERVNVPSEKNGKIVQYARLSDADHNEVREVIRSFWEYRESLRRVLDQPSGLYGSRGKGSAQTYSDVLAGMYEKMHKRHPILHGRVGQDLTIKQLDELNRLIAALNSQFGGCISPVPVP